MRVPEDKTIAFTFCSHPTATLALRWRAKLTFPAGSDESAVFPIEIVDGEGNPVKKGVFDFAGQHLAVRDGRAEISAANFLRGKSEVPLWLNRDGMPPIPGGLTFA